MLVCVTGVSGSGKSTLVNQTLYPALARKLYKFRTPAAPVQHRSRGLAHRQSDRHRPVAHRTDAAVQPCHLHQNLRPGPRPLSPCCRKAKFAGTTRAVQLQRERRPVRNLRGRRRARIEMHFLPDVYVQCEACGANGTTAKRSRSLYKGKIIADVLDMTVDEALRFFDNLPRSRSTRRALARGARAIFTWASRPPRFRAAKRSGSSSPRSSPNGPTGKNALHSRRTDHRPALRRHPDAA